MKNTIKKIIALILFAAALFVTSASARAQDAMSTNMPVAPDLTTNAPAKHHKHDHSVFNGPVSAIDTNAMTLTVGQRTFAITSETKIMKNGQPATLADGVVGEMVGGAFKKGEDGKLTATSIRFRDKADKKLKKSASPNSMGSTTNTVGQ
jgi:hypothetical protein